MTTGHSRCTWVGLLASTLLLLAACGGDGAGPDGGSSPPPVTPLTDNIPLGLTQLSATDRATAVSRLNALANSLKAPGVAPHYQYQWIALSSVASALEADGWVTGVAASMSLVPSAATAADRAAVLDAGNWAVFGFSVIFHEGFDSAGTPFGLRIRGVVALRDTMAVLGYRAVGLACCEPLTATFEMLDGSYGLMRMGAGHLWTAIGGHMQLTTADSVLSGCGGFPSNGMDCSLTTHELGELEIGYAGPVLTSGATGYYRFSGWTGGRVRGYLIDIDCDASTSC